MWGGLTRTQEAGWYFGSLLTIGYWFVQEKARCKEKNKVGIRQTWVKILIMLITVNINWGKSPDLSRLQKDKVIN